MNAPKRAKSRRPACVLLVVASLFMGVVLLLSSRLSTHAAGPSGPLAMTSRWESILSAGAFTANDALGSSYHLIPADNAGLQLWRVLPAEGVQVSLHRIKTKGLGKGAPVQLLPKGTIVIGIEVNSTTSFGPCDPESFVIMVRFPVHGWIQSGPCVSKGLYSNVVLVMADELRVMARRSALAEPPPEHCITAHMLPGVDLAGGDMGPVSLAVTSPVECCALCSRHPGCGGWTIVNDKDCWLKTVGMFEQRGTVGGPASSAITSGLLPAASLTSQPADSLYPPCCALPSQNQNPGNRRPDRPSTTESASIVRITSSRLDWTSQFPIGTGLMGAMVGGTSDAEIIPISIAGFFVSRESRVATTSEAAPHVGSAQTGRATPMSAVRELYLKNDIQGARAALGRAITSGQIVYDSIPAVDVQGADDDSSSKKDTGPSRERQRTVAPLGVFEYLCDLGILFGIPLDLEDEYASESMARSGPRKAISGATDQRGRLGVLARLYSFVYKNVFASSIGTKVIEWIADTTSVLSAIHKLPPCASCKENVGSSINKIELSSYKDISDSYLDLHTGVVNSFYLKGFALPLPDNVFDAYLDAAKRLSRTSARAHLPLYHHAQERSWFASAQDDVIVGRLKGVYIRSIGNVSVQNNSNVMLLSGELISGVSDVTVSFTRDLMKSAAVDGIVYSSSKFQWPDVESKAVISEGVSTPSLISKGVIVGAATSDADIDFSSAGSKVYGVEVTLSTAPNSSTKAPNAIVCAAVVCLSRSSLESAQPQASNDDSAGRSDMPTSSNTVFCPAIDEMHIFVSSGIGKSIYKSNNNFSRVDDIPQLRHMCWSRVNDAVIRGFNRLRQRHITLFSSRKQERLAEVNFAKNSETYFAAKGVNGQYGTCTDTAAASRLASYSSGCVIERDFAGPLGTATTTEKEYASTIDRNLFSQMYNFGSYLMVSSASKSVSNLQGLWADGPTSAWSGDYHLNINLQMNYWAMHTSGMGADLSPPLINLIKTLALAGETAASSLYGCNGWVAHGFTDSSLRGHLHADGQWALCVTCGAWIGLHLWEAVLHEPIATMLINKIKAVRTIDGVFDLDELNHSIDLIQIDESPLYVLVRIFRGIALFFTEYFYISPDGAVHTGPTTSPENSYFTSKTDVQFLTMSPAIDMSILRQVVSALTLSLSWLRLDIEACMEWLESAEDTLAREKSNVAVKKLLSKISFAKKAFTERKSTWKRDVELASQFTALVQRMPGGGLPIIEQQVGDTFEDGAAAIISEYPGLLPGGRKNIDAATIPEAIAFDNVRSTKTGGAKALDLGHRHWSSLHWLYPGTMLPFQLSAINDIKDKRFLYKAAHNTLLMKLRAGGGHTGWSAVWGAALFARLMDAEGAYRLLGRAIQLYTAPNLMGLHPSLAPRPINECETCFYDPCVSFDKSLDDFLTDGVNESMIDPYLRFKKPTPQRKVPPKVAPTLPHKNPSEVSRKLLFEHAADLTTKYPDSRWPDSIDSIASLQLQRRSGRANKLLGRTSAVSSNRWVDNEFFGKGISGKMLEVANLRGKTTRIINPELHFKESDVTGPLKLERGMNTIDDAKYQFDTNAGFVAAVNEMLLQSHIPSHISFLPALPAELSDFGHAKRLNCRGGVTVSMLWEKGILRDVKLHLEQPHPWLNEVAEDKTHRNYPESPVSVSESQADARSNNNKSNLKSKFNTEWVNSVTKLSFDSPNELVLTSSSNSRPDVLPCAALGDSDLERRMLPPSRRFYRTLEIFMFPCTITLQAE